MTPHLLSTILIFIIALVAMAFYTLLERKALGYIQLRKGPNKVSLMGLPQPFADAMKLFSKEMKAPALSKTSVFLGAPILSLLLALIIWFLLPTTHPSHFLKFSVLLFLCASSLNVYATLGSGWSSNSKYSLLGALRSVAQTISYEVSLTLIFIGLLILFSSLAILDFSQKSSIIFIILPITTTTWFITTLAETNRSPFDFAEGESELVSGFNTEYSSGPFALIFMAEYASIIIMSFLTSLLFIPVFNLFSSFIFIPLMAWAVAFFYIWLRGTLPRMRYDRLMSLTWKCFLPYSLAAILLLSPWSL